MHSAPMHASNAAPTLDAALTRPGWASAGATHATGQAHAPDGRLLRARDIAERLHAIADADDWVAEIAALNGSFAVVAARGGELRAAVDRLRSIPLFYTAVDATIRIADHAKALVETDRAPALDPECRLEFQHVGYVTGEETLVRGLRQVRAGHALLLGGRTGAPQQKRYYEFRHRDCLDDGDDALTARLAGVHERVFRRLLDDVGERQIVIPLSGGYDSRLVAHGLRELGARNVLCYTYGLPGNWESEISRELARYLGFDWVMVPYSADLWRAVAQMPEFDRYFMEAGNFASVAHIQDWPAIHSLVADKRIALGAVLVPGHTGDFLTGGHVPKSFAGRQRVAADELLQAILDAHFTLWDWPAQSAAEMQRIFTDRIQRVIGAVPDGTVEEAADAFERWECQERQAKFIVNSVRVYEFFGLEWRLPLYDSELMDFWSRIPVGGRLRRRLYFEFVRRHQWLPVAEANADRGPLSRATVRLIDAGGLRPVVKSARRQFRRLAWRRQYPGDLAWLALVAPDAFRQRYTGREDGHAFFVLRYLDALAR
jgi:asparagine synthase (glutamine-hydrolysing)